MRYGIISYIFELFFCLSPQIKYDIQPVPSTVRVFMYSKSVNLLFFFIFVVNHRCYKQFFSQCNDTINRKTVAPLFCVQFFLLQFFILFEWTKTIPKLCSLLYFICQKLDLYQKAFFFLYKRKVNSFENSFASTSARALCYRHDIIGKQFKWKNSK